MSVIDTVLIIVEILVIVTAVIVLLVNKNKTDFLITVTFNLNKKRKFAQFVIEINNPNSLLSDIDKELRKHFPNARNIKIESIQSLWGVENNLIKQY